MTTDTATMVRWLTWIVWGVVGFILLVMVGYGLTPGLMEWGALFVVTGAAIYLTMVYHHWLAAWRGFGTVTAGCMLALGWLALQARLWPTASAGLHRLNIAVGFLAFGLLIGVLVSSVLLLIYRDASVPFLGAVWLLLPILLLAMMLGFGSMEGMAQARLSETLVLGVPVVWMLLMLCLAPLAFAAHFLLLLRHELTGH